MSFMTWIVSRLNYIGDFFYELYLECYYAGFPLDILDSWFYAICELFYNLAWDFYDFSEWVNSVQAKVADILSWSTIWSYILSYVPNLIDIRDWFYYWWENVLDVVVSWWSTTYLVVQGWIEIAVEGLDDLKVAWSNFWNITLPELLSNLNSLRAEWDNFWTYTLPNLLDISWLTTWWSARLIDIQSLIDSAFLLRSSFWEGWQDWRDKVTEFFTDPEDWLYKAADRIVERFW